MAFDGSVVHAITMELQRKLTEGRILKIAQTEKYELMLTIKKDGAQKRLLISVNPSLPMVYLTTQSKNAPLTAPAFCMLLRKHLTNGRIVAITQPSMERIIEFEIEHFNEMGDICRKTLTVELMGKYSNIIFREGTRILDAIKHVSALMSSVREVLPGREYYVPFSEDKLNPFTAEEDSFQASIFAGSAGMLSISKALYTNVTGLSPMVAEEILYRCGIDSDRPVSSITPPEQSLIFQAFQEVMNLIRNADHCNIIYQEEEPIAYGTFGFRLYEGGRYHLKAYESISALLYDFYSQKQAYTAIRQKTADIRQTVHTLLSKDYKKYDLQMRQLKDTEKKEKFRVYGELLTAYGYDAEPGAAVYETTDFYTGNPVKIPLDPTLSAVENGKNYFKKYAKLKRTADALDAIIVDTKEEIEHLESIMVSLDLVQNQEDIAEIKRELSESGYGKHHGNAAASANGKNGKFISSNGKNGGKNGKSASRGKSTGSGKSEKGAGKSAPLHYVSSDGFHMYVGKNNFQNEYLTFKLAAGSDWWFHAKDIPGSHVIVKCEGKELSDRTFEEAASLAAHYSKSADSKKVEVQYTQRKNLKKPPAAKPGFVVFQTYFSMAADTDIRGISEITD